MFPLYKNRKQRHSHKSIAHSTIQLHLKSLIPDATLEKSFSSVGRIADVVWEKYKLVFEIQCSPISPEEVQKRCQDYEKIGYTPIWILYVRRFNKKILSPAEILLRQRSCFFTDGFKIYDQFEILLHGRRLFTGPPLPINLDQPLFYMPLLSHPPLAISSRAWPISFHGDLLHTLSKNGTSDLHQLEEKFLKTPKISLWKRLYQEIFYTLLSQLT